MCNQIKTYYPTAPFCHRAQITLSRFFHTAVSIETADQPGPIETLTPEALIRNHESFQRNSPAREGRSPERRRSSS